MRARCYPARPGRRALPTFAHALVLVVELYLGLGFLLGLAFAWKLVGRIDPSAHDGTFGFRVLILPGCAALWPWLVVRLVRARRNAGA